MEDNRHVGYPMYSYDIAMIAILIFSLGFGLWKGMAWQLAALASLVLSAGSA